MARSPLTLAASVTSALPRTGVVGVAPLTEGASGRYDAAVATLDDGRRVVIRVPVDAEADAELRAEVRALRALTAGVRAVLPFTAPDVLGQTPIDGVQAVVQSMLPGYRVDAAHIPAGEGVATSIAAALAAVHDLPTSVVRDAGLTVLTATQVRDQTERLLDRAEATGLLPFGLLRRWSAAVGADALWRFETTVTLGGVEPSAFVLEDVEDVPTVTGLLAWGGLSVGDPAADLRWVASAVAAHDDVLGAYARFAHRAPDGLLPERARLHAELEFAKWLVHGHAAGTESVVQDAVELLRALDEGVRDEPPLARETVTIDDAIAHLGHVPESVDAVDTSMQTDAYDAGSIAEFTAEELDVLGSAESDDRARRVAAADEETAPIELSEWMPAHPPAPAPSTSASASAAGATAHDESADPLFDDPDTAARNALRRWTGTA